MFRYDKKLQYPVKIDKPNPRLARIILTQYGGPDGELGASLRYLSQRYSMPFDEPNGSSYKRITARKYPCAILSSLVTWRKNTKSAAPYLKSCACTSNQLSSAYRMAPVALKLTSGNSSGFSYAGIP